MKLSYIDLFLKVGSSNQFLLILLRIPNAFKSFYTHNMVVTILQHMGILIGTHLNEHNIKAMLYYSIVREFAVTTRVIPLLRVLLFWFLREFLSFLPPGGGGAPLRLTHTPCTICCKYYQGKGI